MLKRFNPRSLRFRLTLWYSCALILAVLVLAGASRLAMAVSLDHALDQSLRYRLIGLHGFIDENSRQGLEQVTARLGGLNHLGELFQVFGPKGELIAQSDGLARHHASTELPPDPGAGILYRSAGPPWFPVRMATQRIYVEGQPLIIEVADPQGKFHDVLGEFYTVLSVALPIALLIAVFGGYWLSRRALAPVDQIIDEACAISPSNLQARLSVPASGDELQRLSETLNQMLGRVEQSLLQMRQFTADASHELRAPMTLIYTAAQFALRRERSADELKESLQKILREAKRCTELINQLLMLARSDAGSNRTELVSIDLTGLLEEVASEIRILASSKELTVLTSLPEQPILAEVDEASFRRMLLLLLDNAIKYTAPGGNVSIGAAESAGQIVVAVADTGAGIAADELPLVFDRFWRADKVRSRDAGGTGLGLAIARDIAERHNAELTVESSAGHGSTFSVRLRRSAAHPATLAEASERSV
ncbi:MAG TPA: ATP-binding protein [Bryobacteraceae bacterium]|jgi:heavy metal sensor kinase|nr:ATP-binding protein [Bryobacteraceae bacterium]